MRHTPHNALASLPEVVDFGSVYKGARLSGSFYVPYARACVRIRFSWDNGRAETESASPPEWLTLYGPQQQQRGLGWAFDLSTTVSGLRYVFVTLHTDAGTCGIPIWCRVVPGIATHGDLIVCESAFVQGTGAMGSLSFIRLLSGLDLRASYYITPPDFGGIQPHTILLQGFGLLEAASKGIDILHRLVERGTNLVILADDSLQGAVVAANAIVRRYGMTMIERRRQRPGADDECGVAAARVHLWSTRSSSSPAHHRRVSNELGQSVTHRLSRRGRRAAHWNSRGEGPLPCGNREAEWLCHHARDLATL